MKRSASSAKRLNSGFELSRWRNEIFINDLSTESSPSCMIRRADKNRGYFCAEAAGQAGSLGFVGRKENQGAFLSSSVLEFFSS